MLLYYDHLPQCLLSASIFASDVNATAAARQATAAAVVDSPLGRPLAIAAAAAGLANPSEALAQQVADGMLFAGEHILTMPSHRASRQRLHRACAYLPALASPPFTTRKGMIATLPPPSPPLSHPGVLVDRLRRFHGQVAMAQPTLPLVLSSAFVPIPHPKFLYGRNTGGGDTYWRRRASIHPSPAFGRLHLRAASISRSVTGHLFLYRRAPQCSCSSLMQIVIGGPLRVHTSLTLDGQVSCLPSSVDLLPCLGQQW